MYDPTHGSRFVIHTRLTIVHDSFWYALMRDELGYLRINVSFPYEYI